MRLKALPFLLAMTVGDYALWDWSIADGHDIVSLVAGLTLLPLAAVSLGGLVLAGARLLGLLLGNSPHARMHARRTSRGAPATEHMQHASAAESDSSSRRLAA